MTRMRRVLQDWQSPLITRPAALPASPAGTLHGNKADEPASTSLPIRFLNFRRVPRLLSRRLPGALLSRLFSLLLQQTDQYVRLRFHLHPRVIPLLPPVQTMGPDLAQAHATGK